MVFASMADTRLRPLKAIGAVRRLMRDPDDTRQVFIVLRAMGGRSTQRWLGRVKSTVTGRAILAQGRSLLPVLQDHARLASLDEGSLGRAYLRFMTEQNLSAAGLADVSHSVMAAPASDEMMRLKDRIRDMHDLTHVVTGYGRDPLGELCLLAFNFGQGGHPGMGMIAAVGMFRAGWGAEGRACRRAVVQAWRHGRAAVWLMEQDWEAMLSHPLEDLRFRLRIARPALYEGLVR